MLREEENLIFTCRTPASTNSSGNTKAFSKDIFISKDFNLASRRPPLVPIHFVGSKEKLALVNADQINKRSFFLEKSYVVFFLIGMIAGIVLVNANESSDSNRTKNSK